jgi:tRNA threonylcarbamoyl adenosine modification protein YeaZ
VICVKLTITISESKWGLFMRFFACLAYQLPYTQICMISLALDTSTPSGSLAILRNLRLIGAVMTDSHEAYSTRMFRHLELLMKELGLTVRDFELFSVVAGPGSFTGLRVGITAVKGWSEVFGTPIAAVSGLEALAAQSHSPAPILAAYVDARRGGVYGAVYGRSGDELRRMGEEVSMPPEAFLAHVQQTISDHKMAPSGERSPVGAQDVAFVSATPEVLAAAIEQSDIWRGRDLETVSALLAPAVGRIGLARHRCGLVVDALRLDANYIRPTEAEILWKGP